MFSTPFFISGCDFFSIKQKNVFFKASDFEHPVVFFTTRTKSFFCPQTVFPACTCFFLHQSLFLSMKPKCFLSTHQVVSSLDQLSSCVFSTMLFMHLQSRERNEETRKKAIATVFFQQWPRCLLTAQQLF